MAAVSILTIGAAVIVSGPVSARPLCGERALALDYLAEKYQERPSAFGLAANNQILEILVSKTGSWTILATNASGVSCVVASGEAWVRLPKPRDGPRT